MEQMPIETSRSGCACFDIRANKEYYDIPELFELLNKIAKKWTFQLEKGEETGYLHYQGRISLFKKTTSNGLVKLIESLDKKPFNYIKPTLKENTTGDNFFSYVNKSQTVIEGPFNNKDYKEKYNVPKPLGYIQKRFRGQITLKQFQQYILELRDIYDERVIDIFIDLVGNLGKSFLACYLQQFNKAYYLLIESGERMIQTLSDKLIDDNEHEPKLIIIDIPRALDDVKIIKGLFRAIEQIKTGFISDSRYKNREWIFEPPRIVIFTNQIPKKSYLSLDRWKIHKFNDDLSTYIDEDPWKEEIKIKSKPVKITTSHMEDKLKIIELSKKIEQLELKLSNVNNNDYFIDSENEE